MTASEVPHASRRTRWLAAECAVVTVSTLVLIGAAVALTLEIPRGGPFAHGWDVLLAAWLPATGLGIHLLLVARSTTLFAEGQEVLRGCCRWAGRVGAASVPLTFVVCMGTAFCLR